MQLKAPPGYKDERITSLINNVFSKVSVNAKHLRRKGTMLFKTIAGILKKIKLKLPVAGINVIMIDKMYEEVLNSLPYKSSFRFVDTILFLNDNEVRGEYTLKKDAFFYEDHFEGNPVTPGVIITEIMAQIGLVVLGIHLILNTTDDYSKTHNEAIIPLLTSTEVSFYKMALPGEKVTVISKKQYFRFGKLKCRVEMYNAAAEVIAKGTFAGIIKQVSIKNIES